MAEIECTWCGAAIEPGDGYRLYEAAGERRAAFCRLEHAIPWSIRGPHWEPGTVDEPPGIDAEPLRCALCEKPLDDVHLLLVRHRGEHRVRDDFCTLDHLIEWAKAGGRWG